MKMRDELGSIYDNAQFADLFPRRGQSAESPWRLALVTIMQFAENLTDRQAADAVRSRIDWKYALGLNLEDSGFDFSVLCKFRKRLIHTRQPTVCLIFCSRFCPARLRPYSWSPANRFDAHPGSDPLVKPIRISQRSRAQVLETLAKAAPPFLQGRVPSVWVERYGQPLNEQRLPTDDREQTLLLRRLGVMDAHFYNGFMTIRNGMACMFYQQ